MHDVQWFETECHSSSTFVTPESAPMSRIIQPDGPPTISPPTTLMIRNTNNMHYMQEYEQGEGFFVTFCG